MLTQRSREKELLDLGPDYYSPDEYQHCMKMLFRVNKLFGFFYSTVKKLKQFPKDASLLDLGCGGGLFLLNLARHFPEMRLKGIDISDAAIRLAQQELAEYQNRLQINNVIFELQEQPALNLADNSVDIILTTMVCHHLTDAELVIFLQRALASARLGVIINDLHRHSIAEFFYRFISPIAFNNRLIYHDGLISIRRGFTRKEWIALLEKANIKNYKIKWCFPFRWMVTLNKDLPAH